MPATQSPLEPMVAKLTRQSSLDSEESAALLSLPHRLSRLGRRTIIVREGEIATQCCVLLSGFASRYKLAGSGAMQMLSIHLRGDLLDLHNSVVKVADYSVETLTEATVAFISHAAIIDLAEQYPNVAKAFLREGVIDGCITREWLLNVGQRSARERLSHLLCELALRQEAAGICAGPRYEWPITQEQLGQATGITSVHVSRTVRTLRAELLIELSSDNVTILDWHGLQTAGDFNPAYLHEAVA